MKTQVSFYLEYRIGKKTTSNKIRCFVRVEKQTVSISTGIDIDPINWDKRTESILNDDVSNQLLIQFKSKINELVANYKLLRKKFTANDIKLHFQGKEQKKTFLNLFDECLNNNKHDYSPSNIKKWGEHRRLLVKFLTIALRTNDLFLNEITKEIALKLHNFLFGEYGTTKYHPNYAKKVVQTVNKVMKFGIQMDFLEKNPFEILKIKGKKNELPKFLTQEQVKIISNKHYADYQKHLEKYAKLFIFQCFTGLAFIDLMNLQKQHFIEIEGFIYIQILRKKTASYDCYSSIPLLPEAQEIIDFFGGIENFPKNIYNHLYNKALKEIGGICEIPTKLHTHLGRKTFVDYAINYLNYSLDEVRTMLGHIDERTLKIYGKIDISRIHNKNKNIKKIYNGSLRRVKEFQEILPPPTPQSRIY